MTKMLPLYNFTVPCRGRRAWKTSYFVRAFADCGWIIEAMGIAIFRDETEVYEYAGFTGATE